MQPHRGVFLIAHCRHECYPASCRGDALLPAIAGALRARQTDIEEI